MTVSTIDADGMPDSRMLVLKDLTADGTWCFAGRRGGIVKTCGSASHATCF